jgi:clan AA aspartic protease
MIGQVVNRRAVMPIIFRLAGRPDLTIEFVIDTGFSGALALSPTAVTALGLPFLEDTFANLANDQTVAVPVYTATGIWHGIERAVRVLAVGRRPLLGTALLHESHLGAYFVEGGGVTITPHADDGPQPAHRETPPAAE